MSKPSPESPKGKEGGNDSRGKSKEKAKGNQSQRWLGAVDWTTPPVGVCAGTLQNKLDNGPVPLRHRA